jgi:hypothetical protein
VKVFHKKFPYSQKFWFVLPISNDDLVIVVPHNFCIDVLVLLAQSTFLHMFSSRCIRNCGVLNASFSGCRQFTNGLMIAIKICDYAICIASEYVQQM